MTRRLFLSLGFAVSAGPSFAIATRAIQAIGADPRALERVAVADDTAAIQAMLDRGGYIPPGTYRISSVLVLP